MPELKQERFNFDNDQDISGYTKWKEELNTLQHDLELKHGIKLGAPVRISIKGFSHPAEGILTLAPEQPKQSNEPRLCLSSLSRLFFRPSDIQSMTRL